MGQFKAQMGQFKAQKDQLKAKKKHGPGPVMVSDILLRQAILYVDTASAGRAKNTNLSASALSKTDISAGFWPVLSYKDVQNHPHFPFLF